MEEIKNCPFCGHKATWHKMPKRPSQSFDGEPMQDDILGCYGCHCPVRPCVIGCVKENLIKEWNTRI